MKKIYFLIASLFLTMGAMAQEAVTAYINVENGITDTNNGDANNRGSVWESSVVPGLTMTAMSEGYSIYTIEAISMGYYSLCVGTLPSRSTTYTVSVPEGGDYKITGFSLAYSAYCIKNVNVQCELISYNAELARNDEGLMEASGLDTHSFSFTITDPEAKANDAIDAKEFIVYLEKKVETGVEAVEAVEGAEVIYDLTGRRVDSIEAAGIYIVNGKKVMVK